MPNSSKQSLFGGSMGKPGPEWTEDLDNSTAAQCHFCGSIAGRRSSLPFVWGNPEIWFPHERNVGEKQDSRLQSSFYRPTQQGRQLQKKNLMSDLSNSLYQEQAVTGQTSAPSQDYYLADATLSGQLPEDSLSYGDHHHLVSRSALPLGSTTGATCATWDQGQARTTTPAVLSASTPAPAPSPLPPPPSPPPPIYELSHLYRESLGSKTIPGVERISGSSISPAVYGVQPPFPKYAAQPPSLSTHRAYNNTGSLSSNFRQTAASFSALDPASQGMDGALPRAYGMMASQRLPYDPNYDPSSAMMAATAGMTSNIPSHHPSAADPKKMVDPTFLNFLRAEGLAESTITLLLQHGFDSLATLGMLEDHDVRSVAPNLAQARVLSRVILGCKTNGPATRARSSSFSHRNDFYMQPQGLTMDPSLMQQPPSAIQPMSPRMGEFLGRRPSSAPSQHLLETTTYPGARPLATGTFPVSPGGYNSALTQGRPLSLYNAHTGLAMSAHGQQPPPAPGTPGTAPKTFSGSFSPMELMKRVPNLPPASPVGAPSPLHSPQLLRKGMNVAPESSIAPVTSSSTLQGQNLNTTKLVGRRTGPPVIVSTMTTTPDTSNVKSLLF
ncbi:hypothetical protein D4764_01G0018020 [Takifugu flavidus]|uniref:Uncharacterized protein n=1 Tax=Takifugu flavidus TaxID=433684 RepID=A0A5C6PTY1_9TELE|nr:hypothetical protein D4764_01G0018020 [Takifugu flavidus]